MIEFIIVEDPEKEKEIWKLNPELNYMEPFATFKKTSRRNASKIMNAIWLIYDPKSKFRATDMTEAEIMQDVNKNYLGNEEYDWSPYTEIVEAYKKKCKTLLQRRLEDWRIDLEERDKSIRELKYSDPEERKEKDDMLSTRDLLYKKYLDTESLVKNETKELRMKAGYGLSKLERSGQRKN